MFCAVTKHLGQQQRKGGGLQGHRTIDLSGFTKRVACEYERIEDQQQGFANGWSKGQNRQTECCVQRHSCVKYLAPSVENFQNLEELLWKHTGKGER